MVIIKLSRCRFRYEPDPVSGASFIPGKPLVINSASYIGRGLLVFDDHDLNVVGDAGERFPKSSLYALAHSRVRATDTRSLLFVTRQRRVDHDKPWMGQTFPLAVPNEGDHES